MVNLRGLLARTLGDTALSRALALGLSAGVAAGIAWAGWKMRGASGPEHTLRAQAAVVALTGAMLASYHMHVQELPGLFVLAALCVAAGWLPRERLIPVAVYLVRLAPGSRRHR